MTRCSRPSPTETRSGPRSRPPGNSCPLPRPCPVGGKKGLRAVTLNESRVPSPARPVAIGKPAAPRGRLSKRGAFWLVAFLIVTGLLGSYSLTPLYSVYQDRWHFSDLMLSV